MRRLRKTGATMLAAVCILSVLLSCAFALPLVLRVKAAATSDKSVSLSWNAIAGAGKYEILRASTPTGTYATIAQTDQLAYADAGLTPFTVYFYKVAAQLANGQIVSAPVAVRTFKKLAPPTNLKAIVTSSSVTLLFTKSMGATGYRVERSDSLKSGYTLLAKIKYVSRYLDKKGIQPGKRYYYKVRGTYGDSVSPITVVLRASTIAGEKPYTIIPVKETTVAGAAEPSVAAIDANGNEIPEALPSPTPKLGLVKETDFKLQTLDGRTVALSDYAGKKAVVLNFWATWCPPCRAEMPHFSKVAQELGEDKVVFLMVNLQETPSTVSQFLKSSGLVFQNVLLDTQATAGTLYNITGIPTTFFIDKDGYIVKSFIGSMKEETLREGIKLINK